MVNLRDLECQYNKLKIDFVNEMQKDKDKFDSQCQQLTEKLRKQEQQNTILQTKLLQVTLAPNNILFF